MRKLLGKLAVLLIPLAATVGGINFYVDPTHIFITKGALEEAIVSMQLQETNVEARRHPRRRVQQIVYAKRRTDPIDVLVLGSSRLRNVETAHFGNVELVNANVEFATTMDLLGLYQLYREVDLEPSTVVIGIDPTMLMGSVDYNDWKLLIREYRTLLAEIVPGVKDRRLLSVALRRVYWLQELLSIKNLKRSIRFYLRGDPAMSIEDQAWAATSDDTRYRQIRFDGSIIASRSSRLRSQLKVDIGAVKGGVLPHVKETERRIEGRNLELFEAFISFLQSEGKTVLLVLPPYHPITYKKVLREYLIVPKLEEKLRDIARSHQIRMLGSYDPARTPCKKADFLDDVHVRDSCMAKIMANRPHVSK